MDISSCLKGRAFRNRHVLFCVCLFINFSGSTMKLKVIFRQISKWNKFYNVCFYFITIISYFQPTNISLCCLLYFGFCAKWQIIYFTSKKNMNFQETKVKNEKMNRCLIKVGRYIFFTYSQFEHTISKSLKKKESPLWIFLNRIFFFSLNFLIKTLCYLKNKMEFYGPSASIETKMGFIW